MYPGMPREGNPDGKQAPRHRPQSVHPLLLLSGVLSEGRHAGRPEPADAAAGALNLPQIPESDWFFRISPCFLVAGDV